MTVQSMTGYARAAGETAGQRWLWELRSVNGRGLDLRTRLPPGFDALDMKARAAVQARLKRGSIQLSLTLSRDAGAARIRINREALADLLAVMADLRGDIAADPPRLDGLLGLKGVIETVEEAEDEDARAALEARLLAGLDTALEALVAMRMAEGARLREVLSRTLDEIARLTAAASSEADATPERIRARIASQIAELVQAQGSLAPERLAQEAVLLATRADIREEIDRLAAHVAQARDLVAGSEPAGRKLDFLAQEFMREANTLCAKANGIALTRIGLDLKTQIDQLREQVQNVE